MNAIGRAADGRVIRHPGLGWESGDWGGAEALGQIGDPRAVRPLIEGLRQSGSVRFVTVREAAERLAHMRPDTPHEA